MEGDDLMIYHDDFFYHRRSSRNLPVCLLVLLILIAFAPGITLAASHYVRAGASGDGSSWANAYAELPSNLVRGDTYYIAGIPKNADGTPVSYPGYTFDDPASGALPITIKKATLNDHGTEDGWVKSYGTEVATWQPIDIMTSYITFDGVTSNLKDGYGFEIYSGVSGQLLYIGNSAHDVTVQHAELHFSSRDLPDDFRSDAIYGNTIGKATPCNNITIRNCYIHDVPGCPLLMRYWTNLLFENNWVARNRSTAANHSEGVSTHGGGNFIFRNNVWQDIEGTAVIVNLYATTRNWQIYGNIFMQTADPAVDGLGHGIISDNFKGSDIVGLQFYNNTIVGQHNGYSSGLQFWSNGSTNIWAYNNLWYNCEAVAFNQLAYDYNTFIKCDFAFNYSQAPHDTNDPLGTSGDPFVNTAEMDFHLSGPTDSGMPLKTSTSASSFSSDPAALDSQDVALKDVKSSRAAASGGKGGSNKPPALNFIIAPEGLTDPDGNRRGSDGHVEPYNGSWDRGAYEYPPIPQH